MRQETGGLPRNSSPRSAAVRTAINAIALIGDADVNGLSRIAGSPGSAIESHPHDADDVGGVGTAGVLEVGPRDWKAGDFGPGRAEIRAPPKAIAAAGAVGEPVWNPGRDLIAYMQALTNGPAFTRISFVNSAGQPQYTTLPPAPDISAGFSNGIAAWSPDGQRLAVVAQNTNTAASIWIVTPAANAPFRKLVELPVGPRIRGISWTRDGKAVIFGQHDSTGDIVLMDGGN